MKPILSTFFFVLLIVSCNQNDNKLVTTEIIKKAIDSIEPNNILQLKISKEFVLGKFNYKKDSTFIKVSSDYSTKEIYLNKQVYNAFLDMYNAAKNDSIELKIVSGTRNFYEQKAIWERKWRKYNYLAPKQRTLKILEFSSMPTTSRHHWGTDIDLISLSNLYFSNGKGQKEYDWLKKNANDFGFYQVYTKKDNGRTGYNLEKWHWSFLPLASYYLEFYNNNVTLDDITEFKGSELAKELNIIETYVNGIAKKAINYKQ